MPETSKTYTQFEGDNSALAKAIESGKGWLFSNNVHTTNDNLTISMNCRSHVRVCIV
jgi:hypothetical protein